MLLSFWGSNAINEILVDDRLIYIECLYLHFAFYSGIKEHQTCKQRNKMTSTNNNILWP